VEQQESRSWDPHELGIVHIALDKCGVEKKDRVSTASPWILFINYHRIAKQRLKWAVETHHKVIISRWSGL